MSSMTQNKKEAVIFSYSLILDREGKFITEIKSMPVDDKDIMDKAFPHREERVFFTNVVNEAKRKFIVVHEWLEKYLRVIS